MLMIRREQMAVLSQYMVDRFEDEVAGYLRTGYAEKCKGLTDEELRDLIRKGIKNAQGYGITIEADVGRYIECMLMYGVDFDVDGATAWAGKILNNADLLGREKTKRLVRYLQKDLGGEA